MENTLSIVSMAVSAIAVIVSLGTYYASVIRDRQQATLDAFNLLQNEVLDKLNLYTGAEIAQIAQDVHSEAYKKISVLLARCNHFAVGVNTKIYDKKIVRRLAGRYFIGIYDKLETLIEKKRSVNHTERHYYELEKLVCELKSTYRENE